MEVITSLENKKIKDYSKLLQKKYRELSNMFIVEGEHLAKEAYKHGYLVELIKTVDSTISLDVLTTEVSYDVIKKLSKAVTPQKMVGICKKKNDKLEGSRILILDNIQNPGNLGTIIRSSVAFNIDTIILSNDTVDLYNDKVLRASEGLLFSINIIREDILSFIPKLIKNNYQIIGTKVDKGTNLRDIVLDKKVAFVMGNEASGVKEDVLKLCSDYVYIKMNSNCESLNVGVATSIILYELDNILTM